METKIRIRKRDMAVIADRLELERESWHCASVEASADRHFIFVALEAEDLESNRNGEDNPLYRMCATLTITKCKTLVRALESAMEVHQEEAENA
jgi:hypothetical protein